MSAMALKKMAEKLKAEVEKTAEGRFEKYTPWYTAAAGGAAGMGLGQHLAPAKYKAVGGALGLLAGTAAGVHGGEAIGKKLDAKFPKMASAAMNIGTVAAIAGGLHEPEKTAEEEESSSPLGVAAKSIVGATVGTGLGYAGMKGLDYALTRSGRAPISPRGAAMVIPMATGALGMVAPYLHQMTLEKMRAAHLKKQEKTAEASTQKADGLRRVGQLLSGSRTRALRALSDDAYARYNAATDSAWKRVGGATGVPRAAPEDISRWSDGLSDAASAYEAVRGLEPLVKEEARASLAARVASLGTLGALGVGTYAATRPK